MSGESFHMLGVKAMAERMADHVVGHHPTMPGAGKTAQAVHSTRGLEDSLHASIMTIVPCLCKTMAAATSAEGTHFALSDGTRLSMALWLTPLSQSVENLPARRRNQGSGTAQVRPCSGCKIIFAT